MPRKWEPSPNDAMSLAAFRWFANAIENRAVEMYATDRGTYHHIERILRHALREMAHTKAQFAVSEEDNGCPDGYILCSDGMCAPSCEFMNEVAASGGTAPTK